MESGATVTSEARPSSWDAYNALLLDGELDRFTKILARYELFRKVMERPGDVVEAGVFKGAGALYWAKLLQVFNPLSSRRVVGFDTFDGYPQSTGRDHDLDRGAEFLEDAGSRAGDPAAIRASAARLGLDHRVELVAGDATETIPRYVADNPGFRIAVLNLDFDTYAPTLVALKALWPLVVPGGVAVMDEYAARGWGESDAVDEFFGERGVTYRSFPWALSPTAYVVKGG